MAQSQQLVILPAPPRQDAPDYTNQLNRWLDNVYRYLTGTVYLRGNGLFLPGLPTSGYLLKAGEVFSNGGVLTIVQPGDIWIGGMTIGCAVGSVTVSV